MSIAFLIAAAVAFQGADQFDLICEGTARNTGSDGVVRTSEDHARARVDLKRNLWCWDSCASVQTIADVDNAQIVLMDRSAPNGDRGRITVNRITGAYFNNIVVREPFDYESMITGSCSPAPYTVIPQAAF